MKKINYKNLIILLVMGVASISIIKDFTQIINNATYTWFGLIIGLFKVMILGLGLDVIRG